MTPELKAKLKACPNLPSPPTVATRIIQLANDPEVGIDEVVQVISLDPATSSKVLRIANSPLYPRSRKVENLRQAILAVGLNGTFSLALSFSLVKSLRDRKSEGLNYPLFWRRAVLAGTACRAIGEACGLADIEELFVAALIQDIGMLVLDRVFPGLYANDALDQASHVSMIAHELESVGVEHAAVGAWLLANWNLPERLQLATASSENPNRVPASDNRASFVRCVSLSGLIANLYLVEINDEAFAEVARKAESWLNLDRESLTEILEKMGPLIAQSEPLFDMDIRKDTKPEWIYECARDALLIRNLQTLQELDSLKNNTIFLESQCNQLEETNRRDALTGVFSRVYLDKLLEESFEKACSIGEPLSIAFADLDKFKSINDTCGHQVGDQILKATAEILSSQVRTTDAVGRFGGEEFVLILPGADSTAAEIVCQRIVKKFRNARHEVGTEQPLQVTVSIGSSTHSQEQKFEKISDLVRAADQALYSAKFSGGDRCHVYTNESPLTGTEIKMKARNED